jgi:hypothetical protein
VLAGLGLAGRDMLGLSPGVAPPVLFKLMRQMMKDRLSFAEFGRRSRFVLGPDLQVAYSGHALRSGA